MSVITKLLVVAVSALLGSLGCSDGNAVDATFPDDRIPASTKDVEISYMNADAGTIFVLFSDLPGRDESGHWTAVTVK